MSSASASSSGSGSGSHQPDPSLPNLNRTNIESNDPLLSLIQGNILKSHGRNHQSLLFFQFGEVGSGNRSGLEWLSFINVTSAKEQLDQTILHKLKPKESDQLFINLLLSGAGYKFLGTGTGGTGTGTGTGLSIPIDTRFQRGAKDVEVIKALNDPNPSEWLDPFNKEIHGAILIAHGQQELMNKEVERVQRLFTVHKIVLLGIEVSKVLRLKDRQVSSAAITDTLGEQAIEPFGFADGVSQPLFLKDMIDANRGTGGDRHSNFDPSANLDLVLSADPNGDFGSYVVVRKLEQDVAGFNAKREQLQKALGLSQELTEAFIVGRFKRGTPVVLSGMEQEAKRPEDIINNFNYVAETNGSKCPFHAHIRKTNPRGDTLKLGGTLDEERSRRITRRAIPYASDGKEGLLFMCMQGGIAKQFEFMQQSWANRADFSQPGTGTDPVIGQTHDGQQWPTNWGAAGRIQFEFANFVTMRGGEYFFMPSMKFINSKSHPK